jgi:hypothetical protein
MISFMLHHAQSKHSTNKKKIKNEQATSNTTKDNTTQHITSILTVNHQLQHRSTYLIKLNPRFSALLIIARAVEPSLYIRWSSVAFLTSWKARLL